MALMFAYGDRSGHSLRWLATLVMLLTWTAAGPAQETSGSAAGKTAADNPNTQSTKTTAETKTEVSSKDTGTTFKLRVNVVQVKVVVRDAKGNLVKGLKREDFLLYDQGKLQMISTFGVETPETRRKRAEEAAKTQAGEEAAPANEEKTELPERFVALVFDDIHLRMQDALVVRTSAKVLVDSMTPTDRMAIYSTSGQVTQEFTSDKEALVEKLKAISPRPLMQKATVSQCPDVTYAMADQAINKSDPQVVPVVTEEVLHCQFGGNTQMVSAAAGVAQMALQQALTAGDTDNEYTYLRLDDALKRLTGKPGERVLVLVSPGFILSSLFVEEMGILDRANRSGIVINTVDARGLYVPEPLGDISQRTVDMTPGMAALKSSFRLQEQAENDYVLMDFASGTGGTFFHNSNDLKEGLRLAGAAPEVSYVLGFSPQNQKMDGRYHLLKVAMAEKQKYDIQARRGYYAPKKVDDPEEQAKQEIAEAVFSQDEIQDLPLDFQTQYFKTTETAAHVSVVSRIDLKGVHFRKAEGRNFDNLTVATVIFDDNGNYVTGGEKLVEMRLLDATYERMSHTGLTMKSSFELKPGKYMVRQVIRDSEGAHMAARNGSVVIP